MTGGHFFKRLDLGEGDQPARAVTGDGIVARLTAHVVNRFSRATNLCAIVVPPDCMNVDDSGDCPCCPTHPACTAFATSPYCRESWLLHLAELADHPETHWHRCDHRNLCAVVPVVCEGCCVAAVRVACSDSVNEEEFQRQVELLDLVVWDFERAEAVLLKTLLPAAPDESPAAPVAAEILGQAQPEHPQVRAALQMIDERLSDPKLTLDNVAKTLDLHPNYLSQLFARQVGVRMSRFIVSRRIERAKGLLVSTDEQIKRIARATGFANANWFCHIFAVHTGMTPSAYREQADKADAGG